MLTTDLYPAAGLRSLDFARDDARFSLVYFADRALECSHEKM